MNARLALFLTVIATLLASSGNAGATVAADYEQHGYTEWEPLTFGVEDARWPYSFTDDSGQPHGFFVELTERLLERLGIPFHTLAGSAAEITESANDSTVRLVINEAHLLSPDLHASKCIVALAGYGVAYPKGQPHIEQMADIASQRAFIDKGCQIYIDLAARGWQVNLDDAPDLRAALYKISDERKGQVIGDVRSMEWLRDNEGLNNIEVIHLETMQSKLRFISSDAQLTEQMDSVFSVMRQSGQLDDIYAEWLYPKTDHRHGVPRHIWHILAALALLAFLLIIFWLSIRYKVQRAVSEAKRQNQRLNLILRSGDVEIWTYDVQRKRFRWFSPDMQLSQEYDIDGLRSRVSDYDLNRLQQAIDKVASGKSRRQTLHVVTKTDDEEPHNQEISIAVLKQENGHPTQLIGTEHDTAKERKQRYDEEQTAKRYQMIFSESLIDLLFCDHNGRLTDVNKHAAKTLRISDTKALIARRPTISDLSGFDSAKEIDGDNYRAVTRYDFSNVKPQERKLPEIGLEGEFYYETSFIPIRDDNGNRVGTTVRGQDLTDWVHTFHRLSENRVRLQAAGQQVADIIEKVNYVIRTSGAKLWSFHPESGMLRTYESMNKLSAEYSNHITLSLIAKEDLPKYNTLMERMLRSENFGFEVTFHLNPNEARGIPEYIQMNCVPQVNSNGEVVNYFGSYINITEITKQSKLLDQRRQHALDEERKMSDFLREMSYEIRTPLNNVVGFSELFGHAGNDTDAHQFVKEIKHSANRLLSLINDVLTMARIDAEMTKPNLKPIDVAKNFAAYCQAGWNAEKAGVSLHIDGGPEPLSVATDTTMLQTILHHIVDNAQKFTDKGTVRCSYDYSDGLLTLTVADTGRGMTEEQAASAFGRFKKVNESDGSGLGLSVCKAMTDLLGGTIDICSTPSVGTTVKVTIPCEQANAANPSNT